MTDEIRPAYLCKWCGVDVQIGDDPQRDYLGEHEASCDVKRLALREKRKDLLSYTNLLEQKVILETKK